MKEKLAFKINGFLGILIIVALISSGAYLFIQSVSFFALLLIVVGILLATGIISVQPNQAYAITFFGRYIGSIRESGLWLTVPVTLRKSVSLRVRNFNSKKLKVNDVDGNPIEIASVVVYRVVDSAKALFEVDDYDKFVEIQSETALRHVTSKYPYDTFESDDYSLRGNSDEVAEELSKEVQSRLIVSGVEVIEARLTHLAYSTEIASAMLQRQQAKAILDARRIIVDGAVGMVQLAVQKIEEDHIVDLDEERKATMINNLMVAIVADRSVQPVVNTGSIY
ncbi:SPFH domain-containing protein [Bacillus horti]|uniref:Regulator of protease activity HflC (Stomatin/prohibitin superfamily) n=1 Tax=Caldalkalibacillus horti TaxID=77523 RepID=A0ABT9W3R4_9BACI|nr:SPFH domain-containing protein [Bacillus horti]MDQ0167891.1 regulator of protease activity HflC (stomatin/prohibitin superfamily) [Bacillus horti]